jgi:hypothetical protein
MRLQSLSPGPTQTSVSAAKPKALEASRSIILWILPSVKKPSRGKEKADDGQFRNMLMQKLARITALRIFVRMQENSSEKDYFFVCSLNLPRFFTRILCRKSQPTRAPPKQDFCKTKACWHCL